ncbi:hypothetical protein OG548_41445 [Streptomyces sp. NBC_01356]|uniref:hypothetical protein n=1 Tax=Streptomyces sp. NBC_01356 TaxID=2903836 RepID=UPI002E3257FF|nr:hypothetical protein [Streptomyces sp. NBC_01356]
MSTDLSAFPITFGGTACGMNADRAQSHLPLDAYRVSGGKFLDTADALPTGGRQGARAGFPHPAIPVGTRWRREPLSAGACTVAQMPTLLAAAGLRPTEAESKRLDVVSDHLVGHR